MPTGRIQSSPPKAGASSTWARRVCAGIIFVLGTGAILLGGAYYPQHRTATVVVGLILAVTAVAYLGVELLLRLAVRAVEPRRLQGD
jgi:hypothetical protein